MTLKDIPSSRVSCLSTGSELEELDYKFCITVINLAKEQVGIGHEAGELVDHTILEQNHLSNQNQVLRKDNFVPSFEDP